MRLGSVLAFAVLAGAAAGGWYWLHDAASPQGPSNRPQGRRAAYRDGPVPVTVAAVKKDTVSSSEPVV